MTENLEAPLPVIFFRLLVQVTIS